MKNTKIINFTGAPSAGKSTLSHGLMYLMKMNLFDVEHVSEFAKDLSWGSETQALSNQLYVAGQQSQRIERLIGKVDYIITDSPLFLSLFYAPDKYPESFKATIIDLFKQNNNINYFVNRAYDYEESGRHHTQEQSEKLSKTIYNALDLYGIKFTEVEGSESGLTDVYEDIVRRNI